MIYSQNYATKIKIGYILLIKFYKFRADINTNIN